MATKTKTKQPESSQPGTVIQKHPSERQGFHDKDRGSFTGSGNFSRNEFKSR